MIKKTSFFALLLPLLMLVGCGPQAQVGSGELPDIIKIGWIGPLTGGLASLGQDQKAGVALYFEEHPEIAGVPVRVIYEDGKCNGQDGAAAAQKLVNIDKVKVILGGQCSGETLAAAPITEAHQVILLSSTSSSPEITTAGDYVFRNYPSDMDVALTMVKDALAHHSKFAMLTEQTDYGQGFRKSIKTHLEALGAADQLLMDEAYGVDNTDFRTLLTKVKDTGADALFFIAQTPTTAAFGVKQARELAMDIQFYGGDAWSGPELFKIGKDAVEGAKMVLVTEDPSRKAYQEFEQRAPDPQFSHFYQALGYDGAQIIAEGIDKVGYDGSALKDYLNNLGRYQGVASDVNLDENGDNKVDASVKIVRNGEWVFAE
ncbi:MAG: ABC transporter substrate-binding protein [Candidatus Peregrinibacteria bacterium]